MSPGKCITMLEAFCKRMGIGQDRKIISSRGRTGRVTGIEFAPKPEDEILWVQVDDTPGNRRVKATKFIPLKEQNGQQSKT